MNITATDRSALIRLASSLPQGSAERKAILAGLKAGARVPDSSHKYDVHIEHVDESSSSFRGMPLRKIEQEISKAERLFAKYEELDAGDPRAQRLMAQMEPWGGEGSGILIKSQTDGSLWDWQGDWEPVSGSEYAGFFRGASKKVAVNTPISSFPRTYALLKAAGLWHLKAHELVDSRLFAKSEAALDRASFPDREIKRLAFLLEAGFEPGQTIEEFKADRGFEDEDIKEMLGGTRYSDPPLPRNFPQAVIDALGSFY